MRIKIGARLAPVAVSVAALVLALPGAASAHAIVGPEVTEANHLQLYSLAVPTEKDNLTTSKIVMTVPSGFAIDSFAPPPAGWTQSVQQTGSGNSAVITKVTWTGGRTPTGQDSLFQFLAQASNTGTYTFQVQQTYSDGSIVNWSGPESADAPAPRIDVVSSIGGGGSSTLAIVALIVGILALVVGGFAVVGGGTRNRPLA